MNELPPSDADLHQSAAGLVSAGADAPTPTAPGAAPSRADHPFAIGEVGRYEVRARLGAGGMGLVELAQDRRLLREVALKRPRPDVGASGSTDGSAPRLAQEAWITAQLDHPGIVPVYDAGRDPDGTLYYTMRVIRGRSLEDALAEAPDLTARLRAMRQFLAASEAVAYAHKLGIVHRDLKPQNILVGELGETQVADWGVAHPTGSAIGLAWRSTVLPEGHAVETVAGGVLGTPAYMSPEQSVGADADPRADVWSLGAILYRLLAGHPPFEGATASEVLECVRTRAVPPLPADAPRELAAIAMCALERDPARRYPSARELARDVASWLDGRRVSVHSYSPLELLRRLVSAWRVPLAVAGVALLVLVVGAVFAVREIVAERDRAELTLAQSLSAQALREVARGQWPEAELLAAESLVRAESPEARGILMGAARGDGAAHHVASVALPACDVRALDPTGRFVACGGEAVTLWAIGEAAARWQGGPPPRAVVFADADTLVVADRDRRVHRLARDGQALAAPVTLQGLSGLTARDGRVLAYWGWAVAVIEPGVAEPAVTHVCAVKRAVRLITIGAGGELAVGCDDGRLAASSNGIAWTMVDSGLGPDAIGLVGALSSDGHTLALVNDKGQLSLLDWPSGKLRLQRDSGLRGARALAFGPDDRTLAGTSSHGAARLLDARDGRELERLPRGLAAGLRWDGPILELRGLDHVERFALATTPDPMMFGALGPGVASFARSAEHVAIGHGQGQLEIASTRGESVATLRIGEQAVKSLDFSPDGRALFVAAVTSPSVAVHEAASAWQAGPRRFGSAFYRRVGVLASGLVVAASWMNAPEVFGPDGTLLHGGGRDGHPASELELEPERRWAALLEEGTGRVLTTDGGAPIELAVEPGAEAIGAGRDAVAIASRSALVLVGRDGRERLRVTLDAVVPLDLALAPDAAWIAVAAADGAVYVHDARDGHLAAVLRGHEERVAQLIATDQALWSASWDGTVRRWGWSALTAPPDAALTAARARWGLTLEPLLDAPR